MRPCLSLVGTIGLSVPGIAGAQALTLAPLLDARLRYETVAIDGVPRDADAVTARVRSGIRAARGRLSALVESEATLAIVHGYFDGVNGDPARPLIGDPPDVELNRAQIAYALPGDGAATVGRQLLEIADQRFVGPASFRQNEQTFDAVHVRWSPAARLTADVTYAWSARTINGVNGRGAKPAAIGGDNVFALLGGPTPIGTLIAFAYLVDQDDAAVQAYRLSSQTYGLRLAGARPIGHGLKIGYAGSWARQSGYHRNPNSYAAAYYLAEGSLGGRVVTGTLGYEVLGADRGVALTSVQTPLASLFRFQGWTGRFTTTPPDGVRDGYATLTAGWKRRGRVTGFGLQATWHRFASDRLVRHYGDEIDLLAAVKLGGRTLSARWAHYRADGFAADTSKVWLTAEWAF